MPTLQQVIYQTIHRAKKTVPEIAEDCDLSESYVYRFGLPVESSGADVPLRKLLPLMRSTANFKILQHLAWRCGFLLVKEPRIKADKGQQVDVAMNMQKLHSDAVHKVLEFFKKPDTTRLDNAVDALRHVAEYSISTEKYLKAFHQIDLELEN